MSADVSAEMLVQHAVSRPLRAALDSPLAALAGRPAPDLMAGIDGGSAVNWIPIRWGLAAAYGLIAVVFISTVGVPTERLALFAWVLAGLTIGCVGHGWRSVAGMVRDWLPFIGILVLYDLTRGLADTLGMPVHLADLPAAESWLFDGTLPTLWLQAHVYPSSQWDSAGTGTWWHVVVTAVYTSHFLVTPILAAVLWLRDRRRWISYTAHVVGVALVGVTTYVLVPAAPPWFAAGEGVIPPVKRLAGLGWDVLGLDRAGALLDQGQAKVNLVAALPSLHTAYAALVLVFFWPVLNRLGRILLTAYPLLMGLILVYAGEHYVIDVLLGWVTVGVVALGIAVTRRVWQQHRRADGSRPSTAAHPLVGGRSAH